VLSGERESLCGLSSVCVTASHVHIHCRRHVVDTASPATVLMMSASHQH